MKKIVFTLFAAAMLASCATSSDECATNGNEYVIHGTVASHELEGAKVYLVPMGDVNKEKVDSTYIHNQFFEFRGTEERVVDVRLERRRRWGVETLLVVTEPGDIYVTLGQKSTGRGTPQNDSLQAWKHLTQSLYRGDVELDYFHSRSVQMAKNFGEKSTLGAFLLSCMPEEAKQ